MNRAERRAQTRQRQQRPKARTTLAAPRFGVACDACGKRFSPSLREEPTAEGGMVGLFACPSCAVVYESYHIDREGLEVREELRTVRSGSDEAKELQRRMREHVVKGRGRLDR